MSIPFKWFNAHIFEAAYYKSRCCSCVSNNILFSNLKSVKSIITVENDEQLHRVIFSPIFHLAKIVPRSHHNVQPFLSCITLNKCNIATCAWWMNTEFQKLMAAGFRLLFILLFLCCCSFALQSIEIKTANQTCVVLLGTSTGFPISTFTIDSGYRNKYYFIEMQIFSVL